MYYSYCYIDDWNYRYGDKKILFARIGNGVLCPKVFFTPSVNNLVVNLTVYPTDTNTITGSNNPSIFTCGIPNIPLQKWCNFLMTSYGRTMDLYLDWKLVKTCVLSGVPRIEPSASVYITPNGGFSGWTSRFQYWPDASNPQKAWDVYKAGYGGSLLSSIFGKYTIKVSVLEGDTETSSFEI